MITKWTLSNFKSIAKDTSLDIAPLTLFAGPNSSGKSTVLQSLLLVSQTLSHKVDSRSVVLNGALARLGQFDDLRSHGGEFDQITIGWDCHPAEDARLPITDTMRFPGSISPYTRRRGLIKEISCTLAFDAKPDSPDRALYQLQPQLFLFTMSVLARAEDQTDRRHELTVTRSSEINKKFHGLKLEDSVDEIARASLDYDIVLDEDSLDELRDEFRTAVPIGCILRHFLPRMLSVQINEVTESAQQILKVLVDEAPGYRRVPHMDRELVIPGTLISQLHAKLGDKGELIFDSQPPLFDTGSGMTVREWRDRIRKLAPITRRELRRIFAEWLDLPEIIAQTLSSDRKADEPESRLLRAFPPTDLMNASGYLNTFFSNAVMYLGPLRDDPKPVYPLAAHADPTDVGLRGEMTAAVLNLHRERLIRYIPSTEFGKSPFDPRSISRSFEAAVIDWLKYLGVAETVSSEDLGKLGHELKVTLSAGGPSHDLTHVGVGVSQVLPILVMSLLADQDTTLIFEQPELHLHPKVQTRLADFFLSIVLSGKQCLIETHSEYLINRLRYRAAADSSNNRVTKNLRVYFAEMTEASSTFREVEVNEYGAIPDWPEGFFDQSQLESESILRAAVAKKKTQRVT